MKLFRVPLQMQLLSGLQSVTSFALFSVLSTIFISCILSNFSVGQAAFAQGISNSEEGGVPPDTEELGNQISELRNMTVTETAILNEISLTSTKLATQGAYTAMSVFFLGISLVIFGLRLTTRSLGHMGRYFVMMIWALTLPVVVLVGLYQIGVAFGGTLDLAGSEEPFFLLSFLMYIPIGIVLFLLLAERKIVHSRATTESAPAEGDILLRLERLSSLREKGVITEDELQKLKTEAVSRLVNNDGQRTKFAEGLKGSETSA
jgi:hypothetical protein